MSVPQWIFTPTKRTAAKGKTGDTDAAHASANNIAVATGGLEGSIDIVPDETSANVDRTLRGRKSDLIEARHRNLNASGGRKSGIRGMSAAFDL